ncbi:MAG: membrane dipeptidase, partial [Myxococcales bacterium]|nr:membrane dipeptidase [Myxococcales bacterium]
FGGAWDPVAEGSSLFLPHLNAPDQPLRGYVDLHTHPMSHLAFGGKVFHGAPDASSLMPAGTWRCNEEAIELDRLDLSEEERTAIALGDSNSTHGGPGDDNPCGDALRDTLINVLTMMLGATNEHAPGSGGYPSFRSWPTWDDFTHQHMWVDWVRRTHASGMRVLVALAHHNSTLARVAQGDDPLDDRGSGDLQVEQIIAWAERADFMEVAYTPEQLRDIVSRDKLAIVVGVELDDMGNFNAGAPPGDAEIRREIKRLYDKGVRYIFPVHLTDNHFGGTALYQDIFSVANRAQLGRWLDLDCSTEVGHRYGLEGEEIDIVAAVLQFFDLADGDRPAVPECLPAEGHVNQRRLTRPGYVALNEMMRLGMMIDVDHMSIATISDVLDLAQDEEYPVNSGHNGPRGVGGTENARTVEQYARIAALGGMAGLGWEHQTARGFMEKVRAVRAAMGGAPVGFGTDANSLVLSPPPPAGTPIDYSRFPQASLGLRTWDYNEEGVAHYGLMPDYLREVELIGGAEDVDALFDGAERFAQMWARSVEASADVVELGACPHAEPGDLCVPPTTFGPYCPRGVAGDREFDGHGPRMTATARLELSDDQRRLYVVMSMHALEVDQDGDVTGDGSEAFGEWRELIAEVPEDDPLAIITGVVSPTESTVEVVSSAAGFQIGVPGGENTTTPGTLERNALEELVSSFTLVGDTGGDDISVDADCGDDTRMTVALNPITVRFGRLPEPPPGQERVVAPVRGIGPFCDFPIRRGDAEFDGHGPAISATVRVAVTPDNRQVTATVHFIAAETGGGDSYGEGTFEEIIYTAPDGKLIASLDSTAEVGIEYVADAAGFQIIGAIGDEGQPRIEDGQNLVREFRIVGDTGGPDLSDDADCGDDTRISVEFHPLLLTLVDAPEPPPDTFEVEVELPPTSWLCDLRLVRGDREFGGNGPHIVASVFVGPGLDGRSVGARIQLRAEEAPGDTIAEGTWIQPIWTAPAGQRVVELLSPPRAAADFTSRGHGLQDIRPPQLIGGAAQRLEIYGDTAGTDVS